jgi:trk system potassium uptake protein TrkA
MKIIIAGTGKVGSMLARQLTQEGYDITVIDSDSNVLDSALEHYDVMTIVGNCAAKNILSAAGVETADLLIAATGSDEINLLCCLTAHTLNSKLHTIARIRNPEYASQIYDMRETFALSMTINPEKQAALEIERLLKYPGFSKLETFAKGRVEIVELRVDEGSKLCGRTLIELNSVVKCKILVCTVLRDGNVITPSGNFKLEEGDRIFVTASTENLTGLLKNLGIITKRVRRVLICGGSRIAYHLSQRLIRSGIDVTIIEKNPEKCIQLSALLPEVDIINGDASSSFALEGEGIDRCDALVTLTGMDEQNIIISLYGHTHNVPNIVTKLDHIDDNGILDFLPQSSVVCPKELCCNAIVRYVRAMQNQTGAAVAVHLIADGKAEAIEFRLDKSTPNCGTPLKELKLKKGVLISCITRRGKTEIPDGNSSFTYGDSVVVVTNSGSIHQFGDIFE